MLIGVTLKMKTTLYFAVLFIAAIAAVTQGDVTGSSPGRNTCFCVNGYGVNVRSTACGSVMGSVNSGQCFRYNGAKSSCTLSGRQYEFFQINWNGRNGWAAGAYFNVASDSSCGGSSVSGGSGGSTGTGEYSCEVSDSGMRIHEPYASPNDCKTCQGGNTCRGGQCVAYVKCKCTRNDRYVPQTRCWRQGRKVKTSDGKCNREIAPNTAIATFGSNGRYSEHAAVFIRCIDDRTVQVSDQWCGRSVGLSTYPSSHRFFNAFATITNSGSSGCAGESRMNCRVQNSGPSQCPARQSEC